ncbi:SusC/RagA family TonB-linked outer membrane protein [Sabulilitoribacter multivorans]|uniref:SusC/RagA family TonB-linked outer membrane protein n=1 Tax=Flaviramulus multivorans TaxID=1304750 RepID=A0ABS9II86_9FLAO|nr:SusC/RagA family TonB-linked outer membrane protein [Flaviramulus multivorans]MCF7560473.1 SusC/RagA family TonB-linked outer membrane protein [Flaviramulus multivorans]
MKNKLLKKLLLPMVMLFGSFIYAQSVTGTVSDASGPLPGVNVLVKGTSVGTVTDFDGNFQINANDGDTLVFSYIGYLTQEVVVSGTTVNVTLAEDAAQLDEVVVVGYGSTTKKEITSAVTKVGEEEFNRGTINNPSELLQGKVAGLSIYNKGGSPNEDAVIRLRGISTVGSNSSPLIVIDGIIGASLNNIDPSDIDSMTVLKDGSAAAIYGSRGSSGVIIVTTKRGRAGTTSVDYNGSVAIASIANQVENMSGDEFAAAGGTDLGSRTDWMDLVTRDAVSNIHNVAISGGYDQTSFRVSTNFRDAQGILENSGFKQFNTRLQASTVILDDKLKIDFNASYTKRDSEFGFNEALRYAVLYNPTAPVLGVDSPYPYNPDPYGGYFETLGLFDSFNPVSIVNQNTNNGSRNEFTYGANFKYSVTQNITLNGTYSEQFKKLTNGEYYRTTSLFRGGASSPFRKGLARLYTRDDRFKLFELYGDISIDPSEKLNLKFTGGYSWQEETFNDYFLSAGDFPNDDLAYLDALEWSQDQINAGQISINSNRSPEQRIIAFFARANATFDDAIYFNASLRREGSTKLGENNKWGTFPAFGLGVDLNKYVDFNNVDLFKVRLGYGVTGSLPSDYGLANARFSPTADLLSTNQVTDANPDLKWEQKAETNFGIEFNAGRLSATLDLYTRQVKDFILQRAVDVAVYPTGQRVENGGDLSTNGFELALNYDIIKKEDLTYNSGIVLSSYKTTLDSFDATTLRGNLGAPGQNDTAVILVAPGEAIGEIWGPIWDGTVTNGSQNFVDVNGDGTIQAEQLIGNIIDANEDGVRDGDLAKLGKGIPDFELGWSHTLTYKNWDVNAFFRGAFGHSLVNNFRVFYEPRVGSQGSYNLINTKYADPAITNAKFSSLYVEKADFVKLDNISVGYNFDISDDNKYIKNLRVSLSAQNLFTITGYTGADPEPALTDRGSVDNGGFLGFNADPLTPGIDRRYNYFASRTITLGVNVNF